MMCFPLQSTRLTWARGRCTALLPLLAATLLAVLSPAMGSTWRVGDRSQPWELYPVSFELDEGEIHESEYIWGGGHAVEIVVDDDGDGLIDEDPVDLVDDDGDGLINEDGEDGIDNDRDGLLDEDGPDSQFDNDGDGLLNEDGLRSGGEIYDGTLRQAYQGAPFFRHPTAAAAADDPLGAGYGWGDDDYDSKTNEDPVNGIDDDEDGLVDEDPGGAPAPLPRTWSLSTFAYEAAGSTEQERRSLAFEWDPERSVYVAEDGDGASVEASSSALRTTPRDLLRPIRLDSKRNMVRVTEDRYLSGIFGTLDPTGTTQWGYGRAGTDHATDTGYGQIADGDIFSARVVTNRSSASHYFVHFRTLFYLDLIRMRPRPDFPDRTPSSFRIAYAGDKEIHFRRRYTAGELKTQMSVTDLIIPRQVDRTWPVIKEYRFEERGEYGPPKKTRILNLLDGSPEGVSWELAEFEVYGHGHSLDASYTTEVIDVGTSRPRVRRYHDPEDPTRPVAFESIQTLDANRDQTIQPEELSSTKVAEQFDPELAGQPVTWGRVRWHGQLEGDGANVRVRVRSGTVLDTRIYQRKVGGGVVSAFMDRSIVADWPAPGSRVDVYSYVQLPGLEQVVVKQLPYNMLSDQDGVRGGWTLWTAPFDFRDGLVDEDGEGGVMLPLPPLTRYIQFRFDFESTEESSVSLDYLEFDYAPPVVSRGVVAEIYPDTAAALGSPFSFEYVLKPDLTTDDAGFNRIDLAVPSTEAWIGDLLVDDLSWTRLEPEPPAQATREWLDGVTITADNTYATATYLDSASGLARLGIKTRMLSAADFPRGQDKEILIDLHTSIFKLLTHFGSWVWSDAGAAELQQPTSPGNAADRLPSDHVTVTVQRADKALAIRALGPNPFTPNGDGVNDEAVFDVNLFLLTGQVDVEVRIYDLAGTQVRRVGPLSSSAGEQRLQWNGEDEAGQTVPPGAYLYEVSAASDTKSSKTVSGTICVAY